jgi:hypothetical protein
VRERIDRPSFPPSKQGLRILYERHGSKRICWGSNGPPELALAFIHLVSVDDDEVRDETRNTISCLIS